MRILNCHVHWFPRSVFEDLCERKGSYPRAERNGVGGYDLYATYGRVGVVGYRRKTWFDLEDHFRHMDSTGHDIDIVCSLGPFSTLQKLGLIGVNIPSTIGRDNHIDHSRLEPLYDRIEQLGVPLLIHPTDNAFIDILDGYNGALHLALGRTFDVSLTAARLIFSGIMERHPKLKVYMSHTGGALPYQAGRMDKSAGPAKLPKDPSVYLKTFYTDTVSPHAVGVKFAIEYFGVDHIMFGDDHPCWSTQTALKILDEVGLSKTDKDKILGLNARQFFGLTERVQSKPKEAVLA